MAVVAVVRRRVERMILEVVVEREWGRVMDDLEGMFVGDQDKDEWGWER